MQLCLQCCNSNDDPFLANPVLKMLQEGDKESGVVSVVDLFTIAVT